MSVKGCKQCEAAGTCRCMDHHHKVVIPTTPPELLEELAAEAESMAAFTSGDMQASGDTL